VACDYAEMEKAREFLPFLRSLTASAGALLVFDEIVTGFRVALGGASEYFGVVPDMAAVGKGMANGMPISAYVGRADLLDSAPVLGISSTFGGDALSLAAARATLRFYREHGVIEHLWATSRTLWSGAQDIIGRAGLPGTIRGLPVCPWIGFDTPVEREAFFRACYRHGLSLYDVSYVTWSHRDADVQESLARLADAMADLERGAGP
jgi:glutamate-1-semialdehyde 2,1-aminomutase